MAEIRVRDADPQLINQLQAIEKELGEETIAGCIKKLIPKYHGMKQRIRELERELSKTDREKALANEKLSQVHGIFRSTVSNLQRFYDHVGTIKSVHNVQLKRFLKLGTKKPSKAAPRPARKRKIVPSKKKKK